MFPSTLLLCRKPPQHSQKFALLFGFSAKLTVSDFLFLLDFSNRGADFSVVPYWVYLVLHTASFFKYYFLFASFSFRFHWVSSKIRFILSLSIYCCVYNFTWCLSIDACRMALYYPLRVREGFIVVILILKKWILLPAAYVLTKCSNI